MLTGSARLLANTYLAASEQNRLHRIHDIRRPTNRVSDASVIPFSINEKASLRGL